MLIAPASAEQRARARLAELYTEFKRLAVDQEKAAAEELKLRSILEDLDDRRWRGDTSASRDKVLKARDVWRESELRLKRIRQAIAANYQQRAAILRRLAG